MPIYEYQCAKCGSFEYSQSIKDPALTRCPTCRRRVHKLVSAPSFHLKGGGWYADGYATKKDPSSSKEGAATASKDSTSSNGSSTSEASKKTSNKAESKAAESPKPASDPSSS